MKKDELISQIPELQDKQDRVFVVDCIEISLDTIGRAIPRGSYAWCFNEGIRYV